MLQGINQHVNQFCTLSNCISTLPVSAKVVVSEHCLFQVLAPESKQIVIVDSIISLTPLSSSVRLYSLPTGPDEAWRTWKASSKTKRKDGRNQCFLLVALVNTCVITAVSFSI